MKQELRVEVKSINYQDESFVIFRFALRNHIDTHTTNLVAFGSICPLFRGDILTVQGEWVDKKKYGLQFRVDCVQKKDIARVEAVQKFLVNIGRKGRVGKRTIEKIVDVFKEGAIEAIQKRPEDVMALKISERKVHTLQQLLLENRESKEVFDYFKKTGLSADAATRLHTIYEVKAINRAKHNPYSLYDALSFEEMDIIAEHNRKPYNSPERLQAAIMHALIQRMNYTGELYIDMDKDDRYMLTWDYLKKKGAFRNSPEITREELTNNIYALGVSGNLLMPERYSKDVILIKKYWQLIEDTAERMNNHIKRLEYTNGYEILNEILVEKYLKDKTITYNEEQLMAIKSSLNHKISVITGGPGTGKTQTIRGIIEAFYNRHLQLRQEQGLVGKPNIQLCAPTGKAAQRIMDLTGKDAITIHRLLGIRGGDVVLHELEEVQADLIIIDEASMIDSQLFFYLISAIKPYTHIVMIGDADQLPSIGRGFILRDLIGIGKGGLIGYAKLTRVYRQVDGNPITENAYSILRHREGQRLKIRQGSGFEVIEKKKQEEIRDALLEELGKHIQEKGSLDGLQILTPLNKGALGVEGLNIAIQDRFNNLGRMQNMIEFDEVTFRVNDRVMQTVNNYVLEVFNGEVGKIVEIKEGPKIEVDYGYKTVEYVGEDIKELTLAYAITVHKSQGSEFDKVIMPLDRGHQLMLDKRLLYTAITRAKNEFLFIGSMETLRDAALKETEKGTGRNLLKKVLEL